MIAELTSLSKKVIKSTKISELKPICICITLIKFDSKIYENFRAIPPIKKNVYKVQIAFDSTKIARRTPVSNRHLKYTSHSDLGILRSLAP